MARCGLLVAEGKPWSLSPAGRAAAATGSFDQSCRERRSFWFADNVELGKPPSFLLPQRPLDAITVPEDWNFPAETLAMCVCRSVGWKQRHRFAADVRAVVDQAAAAGDWRAVMIDRAEQFLGVVVEATEGAALSAYAVRPDSWSLERDPPVFTWSAGWEEELPDLAVEPPLASWRQAWLAWCQPRGVAESDADACHLEREAHRMLVRAPQNVAEKLRTARDEPLTNEAWLLAGSGRFRAAAQIEMAE